MKLLLIAGHGANDPGAVSSIDGVSYRESDLTRDLVTRIKNIFSRYKSTVDIYDTKRNAFSDSKTGTLKSLAGFHKYDYVLEIHFNAFKKDAGDGSTKGVEIYYPSTGTVSGLENLICSNISKVGLRNRGTKKGNFAVINTARPHTKANLLEVCFLDDTDDMRIYLKNKDKVAEAIVSAISNYFNLEESPMTTPTEFTLKLPVVKNGSRGNTVKALQLLLNGNDCPCGSADSIAGAKTVSGIKEFQKKKGIPATGEAGFDVFNKLLR